MMSIAFWCVLGFVAIVILLGIAWARAFGGHDELDDQIQAEINSLTDEDVYGDDVPGYDYDN